MEKLDFNLIIKKSVRGVLALISRTFFLNIISFGAFLIITGFLPPKDFGIYTVVIAMQRIISFFTDFGLGAALIQKKQDIRKEDIVTGFTIQAGVSLLIFILVFTFQGVFSNLFKLNDDGLRLLLALVFTIFLSSFKTIPSILLERSLNFGKLVLPQIVESLIFNFVLVGLVISGYGINSFTWAFLLSSLLGIPFYYFVSPWKIGIGIDRNSLVSLKYGLQFQAKNILATIKDDLLTVILTRFLTFTEIGYIGFAQRFAFYIYRYVVDSVTKVTFSAYARVQGDIIFLRKAIEKSLFFIGVVMFPALFGLIVIAPYLIEFYPKWNNKWEPAIFSIVFFCLNAIISSFSGILVNVLDATGKVKITLRLMIIWTVLIWILTPIFIYFYGYNGVSVASFLVSMTIVYTAYLVKKVIDFNFLQNIYKSGVSAILMAIVVFISGRIFVEDVFSLIFVILIGMVVYIASLIILARKEIGRDIMRFGIKI